MTTTAGNELATGQRVAWRDDDGQLWDAVIVRYRGHSFILKAGDPDAGGSGPDADIVSTEFRRDPESRSGYSVVRHWDEGDTEWYTIKTTAKPLMQHSRRLIVRQETLVPIGDAPSALGSRARVRENGEPASAAREATVVRASNDGTVLGVLWSGQDGSYSPSPVYPGAQRFGHVVEYLDA